MSEPVVILKVDDGYIGDAVKGWIHHSGQRVGSDGIPTFNAQIVTEAKTYRDARTPVHLFIVGMDRPSIAGIKVHHEPSYIVASSWGYLELNPYYQRWYWCGSSRYATPLTLADAERLRDLLRLEPLHDASQDEKARVLPDNNNRTPQIVPPLEAAKSRAGVA